MTPTFTFSWDTNKQKHPQSKVFKKRNASDKKVPNKIVNRSGNNDNLMNVNDNLINQNNNETIVNKHIKRKKRKDKLIAKQLQQDGVNVNPVKSTEAQKKNYSLFAEAPKKLYINTSIGKSPSEQVFANSGNKFSDLNIHPHLISNLEKIDFKTLTNVQEKAIPIIMKGKNCLVI